MGNFGVNSGRGRDWWRSVRVASEKFVQDIEQMQLAHKSIVAINETKIRKKSIYWGQNKKNICKRMENAP